MFRIARPIFPLGKERELNTYVTFHGSVETLKNAEIHITAADFYQLYVDGRFVAFGPARAAKGYAREDVISLDAFGDGEHAITVAVSGYYVGSLSTVKQPGFLWCEIVRGAPWESAAPFETADRRSNDHIFSGTHRYVFKHVLTNAH